MADFASISLPTHTAMDSPRDPLAAFLIGRGWLALKRTRPDSTDFSPSMSDYRDRLALP
jgi:hypothetical protein